MQGKNYHLIFCLISCPYILKFMPFTLTVEKCNFTQSFVGSIGIMWKCIPFSKREIDPCCILLTTILWGVPPGSHVWWIIEKYGTSSVLELQRTLSMQCWSVWKSRVKKIKTQERVLFFPPILSINDLLNVFHGAFPAWSFSWSNFINACSLLNGYNRGFE